MINQRLFDHYHIDTTKHLNIAKTCGRPFDTILIDKLGSCYACECTAWLPQSIGNIQIQTLDQILESKYRKHLQDSVSDHSYRYCNQSQCSYLKVYHKGPADAVSNRGYIPREQKEFTIRLAIDDSCNLQCPSCRQHRIFEGRGTTLDRKRKWINKIVKWIDAQTRPIRIVIGSDGDPFASLVYRYFMVCAEQHKWTHVTYDFQTNGLLLKKMYNRYRWVFDRTNIVNISIDGSNADVYEKLRLGGNFQQLMNNMAFLNKTKRKFKVHLHMVVQKSNWQQMPNVLDICNKYGFEQVFFNLIQDWTTGLDIKEQTNFTQLDEYKKIKLKLAEDSRAKLYQLP